MWWFSYSISMKISCKVLARRIFREDICFTIFSRIHLQWKFTHKTQRWGKLELSWISAWLPAIQYWKQKGLIQPKVTATNSQHNFSFKKKEITTNTGENYIFLKGIEIWCIIPDWLCIYPQCLKTQGKSDTKGELRWILHLTGLQA